MKRWIVGVAVAVAMLCSFAVSGARAMDRPRVQDDGKFFSPEAATRANDQIARIKRNFGKDVYVESWPSVPSAEREKLQSMGADKYFTDALNRRAAAEKVDGIIVLISRNPSHLRVGEGSETGRQAFIPSDRDALTKLLLRRFKASEYDAGLLEGLDLIEQTFTKSIGVRNAPGPTTATPPPAVGTDPPIERPRPAVTLPPPVATDSPRETNRSTTAEAPGAATPLKWGMGTWLCLGAAVLVVFMIMRAVSNARRQQQQQGYGAPPPPIGGAGNFPGGGGMGGGGMGGGGMGRGMLGGLLGGLLGGYAYDRWARGGSHSETYIPPDTGAAGAGQGLSAPPTDVGTDFTSSGGDFGSSDSAGGDIGAGDSSGGDFGGGGDSSGGDF